MNEFYGMGNIPNKAIFKYVFLGPAYLPDTCSLSPSLYFSHIDSFPILEHSKAITQMEHGLLSPCNVPVLALSMPMCCYSILSSISLSLR